MEASDSSFCLQLHLSVAFPYRYNTEILKDEDKNLKGGLKQSFEEELSRIAHLCSRLILNLPSNKKDNSFCEQLHRSPETYFSLFFASFQPILQPFWSQHYSFPLLV